MADRPETMSDLVPRPDPTLLTTAALKLSIDNLKELFFQKLDSAEKLVKSELSEIHKLLVSSEDKRLELKQDSDRALRAALMAQEQLFNQKNHCNEEASTKTELSFTKQVEALSREAATKFEALSDKIVALKERLDRGGGKDDQQVLQRGQSNWMIGLVVLIVLQMIEILAVFFKP